MRYVLARAAVCAAAVALPSCYWLTQDGDLSSSFGDAGPHAEAPPVSEGGGLEATDGGGAFCPPDAGALAYCMDFDGVDVGVLGLQVNGAEVAIVDGPSVSPPSSLSVGLDGVSSYGRYPVSFSFQPTTTRLEFQIQAVNLNEGVTTLAVSLLEASTQTVRTLNVVVTPYGGFQVQEYFAFADGGSAINAHSTLQVDAGGTPGWHHVVLTLTVNDASKQYLSGLTVDNQVLEEGETLALPWAEGVVSLHLGATFAAAGGPKLFFDNIRADFGL